MADLALLWIRLEVQPADRRELSRALLDWSHEVRVTPGARDAVVAEDIETPGVFVAASTWLDKTSLDEHLSGNGFHILVGAASVLASRIEIRLGHEIPPCAAVLGQLERGVR